jgi:hypothetical protein
MMWPWVSRARLEEEQQLRRNAEAAFDNLLRVFQQEREAHARQLTDVLDRALPKPQTPQPGFGLPPGLVTASADALRRVPAVGKRGIRERNAAVRDADERENHSSQETEVARQRGALNEDEMRLLDEQIPR